MIIGKQGEKLTVGKVIIIPLLIDENDVDRYNVRAYVIREATLDEYLAQDYDLSMNKIPSDAHFWEISID